MLVTRSTLEAMAEAFGKATCPEEVFGGLAGSSHEKLATLKVQVRNLTRSCHPDNALSQDKNLATDVFQSLSTWEGIARQKIESGTYGDRKSVGAAAPPYTPVEFKVRGKTLTLTSLIAEGVFASVHQAEYDNDAEHSIFVKYTRDVSDNDLLEREFSVLKSFHLPEADPDAEAFFARQRAYVPYPISSFSILDEIKTKHRANLLRVPKGPCYTVETLRKEKFPGGIEPRHVWWIFRRLLLTLWMSHLKGYIHGGVTPDHVLIFPEEHGIVLLDWTCAAKVGEEYVPAINPEYQEYYPPELLRKEVAAPSADIFMAASTALYMLGSNPATLRIPDTVSEGLKRALLSCLAPVARRRPQDAEIFHNEFGNLLGKRTYSHMVIP
ncbi:hypothetical protein IAD21_05823 [Abditibacteriota bacterium]|nr:hypothetical protein IAD21_05823 [Abditibacteriota bacterium]